MNNELTVWNYGDNDVRILMIDDEPWLVLADVCRVLELSNPTIVAGRLDADERAKFNLGRQGETTIISESGFYSVVLRSDKPQAKPFRKWVTSVVLPSIRKNGFYAGDMNFSRELQVLIQHERMMAQHQKQLDEYLYNIDAVTANAVINYTMKEKFHFKTADLKPLIAYHKEVNKNFENKKRAKQHIQKAVKIPAWYEETEHGLKFLPDILAIYLAKAAPVFYAAEQHYRYEHGVYTEISELDAKNMVREQMLTGNTKLSQISDAEGQWRMQIQRDVRELNANPYLINVRNGLYNVLENTLIPHSPEYLSTVQLNVSYVPDAKCPMFLKFLHDALSDEQVYLVQEILGYFLIPINRAQKSFVIVGEAGAGKSLLLLVLNDILLGRENVSNVSWQSLNERFKTAELFGKLANIFADLPTKNIDDNGIFKALVGEDYLTVERKNKNPFSFQPYARLLFSCNKIPKNYGDKSEGFYRRLIIIRFNHAVPEEKRDPAMLEKFRTEANGIFLFALEGLKRLMNNHYKFSVTSENLEELQKYREESNSVLSFVKDCCELDSTGEVSRSELYTRYKAYCEDAGLTPYAQRTFNAELETCCPSIQRAKDTTGKRKTWRGLKLADTD